jgi:tetratricopeptide (TPR) repeat protein
MVVYATNGPVDDSFHKTRARVVSVPATRAPLFRLAAFAALGTAVWFCLAASTAGAAADLPLSDGVRAADDFFLGRRNLENVNKAIQLLRERLVEHPRDYEAWWRESKFICYLARHSEGSEQRNYLEEAVDAGKKAVALEPNRPEGHFWLGVNLGLEAEQRSFVKGLTMVDSIRKEMETVIRLDPNYEEAGGERTLARLDYRAPFFKGGDKLRSIKLLEDVVKRYPHNSLARLYLSDSYLALGRRQEARQQLEIILNLCPDPEYGPEQEENQAEARQSLARNFAIN